MTWNQFVEMINKQLEEKGISKDTEVWYIDVNINTRDIEVSVEEDGIGLSIY